MKKNQNGLAVIGVVIVALVLIAVAACGFTVYHAKNNTKAANVMITKHNENSTKTAAISKEEAFKKLHSAYLGFNAETQKECPSFEKDCLGSIFSSSDKHAIAQAYGVTTDAKDTVYFGLQLGKSLDIGGIGTGYLDNKSKLMINDTDWYWEIGACGTNNRIYINAESGQTAGIHNHTYCGGVE